MQAQKPMTSVDVAKRLGISASAVARYARIVGVKRTLTGRWHFTEEDVAAIVAELRKRYGE